MATDVCTVNSPRESWRKIWLSAALLSLPIVALGLLIAANFGPSSSARVAHPRAENPPHALLAAIRDGDHNRVGALLDLGAYVEARNEIGDTALMQAAMNSDVEMVRLLLQRGANPNAHGVYAVTPILRAIHDPDKVELLLRWGARVDERAMVIAAMTSSARTVLELLSKRGGDVNASVGGYTVLMAAAYGGDVNTVKWLVEHGADVKARSEAGCTALHGAALSGNPAMVKLLLDRAADPNVRYQEPDSIGDFQTPLLNAAWHGHAQCVKLLLEHGADVNIHGGPFARSPLLCAATTGSDETVRLLLANGANVRARDWKNDTALDWALLRGETTIVGLLRKANGGGRSQDVARTATVRESENRLQPNIGDDSIRRAVSASLRLLQRTGQKITRTRKCVTCHQHSLVAMAVGMARRHGFAVDEAIAQEERAQVQANLEKRVPLLLLGAELDPTLAAYTLVGFKAEDKPADALTDALVHYLVLHQRQDGRWPPEAYRPPEDGSAFLFTALAARGLRAYAPKGRSEEIAIRIQMARDWLEGAQPMETSDCAFQLLGLKWAGAGTETTQKVANRLLGQQRPDGGWSQLPTLPSDAYATGLTLFALHEGGGLATGALSYRRGTDFLMRTQFADGSWYVRSRCFPALAFSSSGFPHGRSQFISAAATCWASKALMLTQP